MGCSNFSYCHRCVIVPDEDLCNAGSVSGVTYTTKLIEDLNTNEHLSQHRHSQRAYPSYVLRTDFFDKNRNKLVLHRVVLTLGYYEAACLDYINWDIENEFSIDNIKDNIDYVFSTIFESLVDEYLIGDSSYAKLCNGIKDYLFGEYEKILNEDTTEFERKLLNRIENELTEELMEHYKAYVYDIKNENNAYSDFDDAVSRLKCACMQYAMDIEKAEINFCNDYIDKLKEYFGFDEYACVSTASNGEAYYEKIEK